MKFLPLIWSGIWRKPGRTILIFLQVSVAFALFGVLQGLKTGVAHAVAAARADLLLVHSRESYILQPLPLGLLDQIRSVPGVKVAIPVELTGATYQKPTEGIGIVAVSPEDDWPSPQKNGSTDWAFDVVGTFTDSDVGVGRARFVLISFPYFDEARAAGKATVNHFNVAVSDPKLAVPVADAIDRRFANSSHETKTESLRELAQANVQRIGDFDFLLQAVVGAVLVALLFATTTMMIQSTRERTPELAVIKTLGFTDHAVFLLILAEALVIFLGGAALGLALATLTLPLAARFVLGLSMPGVVVVIGLVSGALMALVSAAVPAALAARLRVATALGGHGAA
ncbi:MAG: FtsX-like permease family protein [Gammaproteobacteria bacterium]|nr:MAG: FtsX-like permease family protein [Gammaproteobacteria bacterium]